MSAASRVWSRRHLGVPEHSVGTGCSVAGLFGALARDQGVSVTVAGESPTTVARMKYSTFAVRPPERRSRRSTGPVVITEASVDTIGMPCLVNSARTRSFVASREAFTATVCVADGVGACVPFEQAAATSAMRIRRIGVDDGTAVPAPQLGRPRGFTE